MLKTIRETMIGKATIRLVETGAGYTGLVFVGGVVKSRIEGSDADDVWRRLHDEAARSNPGFFGFDGARRRFLRIFHDGFSSPAYFREERDYKLAAKEKLDARVPIETALDGKGLGEAAFAVFQATNLLSPFEKVRMQEVLRGPHADRFIRGAARFTVGDTRRGLSAMEQALKPHEVAKWTAVTYLPFLWRPDAHMFLKPMVTKDFAGRVGHGFANDYSPRLDEAVYLGLLDLVGTTEREIADLDPRDRIDIQSFIWVVGDYDVEAETGVT